VELVAALIGILYVSALTFSGGVMSISISFVELGSTVVEVIVFPSALN